MTETPPEPTPEYATVPDVVLALGALGPRVEATPSVDLASHLSMAHAEVLDRLADAYGTRTLPVFTGDAMEAARWAEARIAAANVLDILRASLTDVSDVPERLRRSAWATIDGGLPGFRPGDPDPGSTPPPKFPEDIGVPRVSSCAPGSNFPDPYVDPLRTGDTWPLRVDGTWTW